MSYRRWKQLAFRLRPGPRVALFPFLAVLICTMGALVPLLLAMAHQARLSAQAEAQARTADRTKELDEQREAVQWRVEQLRAARRQTEAQWEKAQQYLGHLEDHSRRLEEEIRQLRREQELLQQQRGHDRADLEQLEAQCRQVEEEIARAEAEATLPRTDRKQRSYALVPFVGPNRTQRRPIYLECTARAVIVQPEGIRLTAEDFDGPLGASNPLISVVRAAREQMVLSGAIDPDRDGEPYPLLLVRPDGVAAYHYARVALKPWGPDFGYELISAELSLAYPPPDARLAEVMQTALTQARQVQARLIAAAPRSYGNARRMRPGPADEAAQAADATVEAAGVAGAGSNAGAARAGTFVGPGGGSTGTGTLATGTRGATGAPAGAAGFGGIGSMTAAGSAGGGAGAGPGGDRAGLGGDGAIPGSGGAMSTGTIAAGSSSDQGIAGVGGRAGTTLSDGEIRLDNPVRGAGAADARYGAAGQRPASGQGATSRSADGGRGGAVGALPGQWQEKPPGTSSTAAVSEHQGQPGATERHASSRARNRPDWALPEAGPKSTGIVRPIRVELYADRMIVGTGTAAKTIALPARTAAVTDELVAALWAQMDSWGIAGKSAHWRPVLAVEVAPGADGRYADLTRMLEGSGVAVERRASARVEGGSLR